MDDDIFLAGGRVRPDILTESAARALRESLSQARLTRWESVRTPHLFMGLLAAPDNGVCRWAQRLGVDIPTLLEQFQTLFSQDTTEAPSSLLLNREFLSDNVIRILRDALLRAKECGRCRITPLDLLITLFTTNSIVAECFERIGVTAAKLTEIAVRAEYDLAVQ